MRSYSFTCLALIVAGALACDSKGGGTSDTSEISGTDGSTDGMSSTDGTDGPMTSGNSSITSASTSATSGTTETTTGGDPTVGTSTTSGDPTVGTSTTTADPTVSTATTAMTGSASDTTGFDPIEPTPCEGEAVVLDVAANAYLEAEVPPMPDPTGGSSGSSGGEPNDPNTMFVRLSNQVATCADPDPSLGCGLNWEVSIRIPTAFQTPGLYHLLGPDVTGSMFETGVEGGGDCSFGGGSFEATFELISIDDKSVTGRLCHVKSTFFEIPVDLEGSFEASRCP